MVLEARSESFPRPLEVAYLLLMGEKPTTVQLEEFRKEIQKHMSIAQLRGLFFFFFSKVRFMFFFKCFFFLVLFSTVRHPLALEAKHDI